ncbi:ATP-grasp fold amidoligase family protein [Phosphitispora sp. TUW77]|uniref:ATP-grasp fold amidoligase family protein n=1 Tax=Phosphitispora sp. TUW77 TaxID=3152361 RepID=UPI003AB28184
MKRNYYFAYFEWPYKNIKPRIICKKYMVDESGIDLKDYKFICFNGKDKIFVYLFKQKSPTGLKCRLL